MPAIAAITLLNGEATPVNHTFNPLGQDPKTGIWWFEDSSPRVATTSVLGFPRIGVHTKRGALTNAEAGLAAGTVVNRVQVTIALPQLETLGTSSSGLTPAPTISYIDRAKIEFILPARDGLADRKDLLAYSKNILSNASVVDLVHNLTAMY